MSFSFDPGHLRLLLDKTGVIPWRADAKTWLFTHVGAQAEKLLGYPLTRWYEKDFWVSHLHPDDRKSAVEFCRDASDRQTNYSFEYRMLAADGRVVWIHDIVHVEVKDGAPDSLLGFLIDITERKQAAERSLWAIEAAPNAMVMINPEGRIALINRAVETVFGYAREELIGRSIELLVPERFRELQIFDRPASFAEPRTRTPGPGRELLGLRKDGSEVPIEIGLTPIQTSEGPFGLASIIDISAQKNSEIEAQRQRAELAHVMRLSVMGELSASLAHELNQPLTAILSNAQAAQRFLAADPPDLKEVGEILNDIVQDNTRAAEVIRRMRAFIKKEKREFERIDLADVLGDVVLLSHSDAVLHNVRVSPEFSGRLLPARGDRIELQQVVLNLLLNAFDAMKETPENERRVVVRADMNGADMIRVAVQDRGTGLSRDKLDKIFNPFYTTKRDGLGMGLSISRSIIEAHGGRLWVENNPEGGATFYFTIPVEKRGRRRASQGAWRRRGAVDEPAA